ncbi:MAG: NAD+ synthase [Deltaproteobacteria bacterium]|nr:NAD+ synthase [Deltaproteobacteria bacterium]
MKIALAQINTTVGDVAGNRDKVIAFTRRARERGADLVVFPELTLTGYPPRDLVDASGFVQASEGALAGLARETRGVGVLVGTVAANPDPHGPRYRNVAALLDEGRVQSLTTKCLLPSYDVFDEVRYFAPSAAVTVKPFRGRRLGVTICEDAWAMETFSGRRIHALNPVAELAAQGADLIVNLSGSPFERQKPERRLRIFQRIASDHGLPSVFVNLVGGNDGLIFDGDSFAVDAQGRVAARAGAFEEDLVLWDTESGQGEVREEVAPEEEKIFRALCLGTRDYAAKCGFRTAVTGLSGGIDSALVTVIAACALGPENVHGISLPSAYSSEGSLRDARLLAGNLGIHYQVIPIEKLFQAYLDELKPHFGGREPDATEENIQARVRGNILMSLSNKFGHLVLSTGNKSELAVGYCTLYGDMAGGLAVVSDLLKTEVYALARHLNRSSETIPEACITKPPSAELRPNQTDQDTLPPYEALDPIIDGAVEESLTEEELIARGHDEDLVRRVYRMIRQNEYKRQQAPPGLKVTGRAFGVGRRYPIAARYRLP